MRKTEDGRQKTEAGSGGKSNGKKTGFDKRLCPCRPRGNSALFSQKGFTLIEVLIAITVFSVGVLAVAAMQSHSTTTNAKAMAITHATTLAAEKVEEFEGLDANGVDLSVGSHNLATNPAGFQVSWKVTGNTPMPGMKQVVVTVTSTSGPQTTTNLTYYKAPTY